MKPSTPSSPLSKPEILGIPVRYDPKFKGISDSRGLGRRKIIVVGPVFTRFPPKEQAAILLHEAGHCRLRHLEKRIARLWMILWSPRRLAALCVAQELEADRFAAAHGHGPDLARAFARLGSVDTPLHPPLAIRIARLAEGYQR